MLDFGLSFKSEFMAGDNLILNMTFDFSLRIVELYRHLTKNKEFVISKQLLKCGTSIGANVEEANAAVSKKDFVNKMAISSKEARETKYWLRLLDKSQIVQYDYSEYLSEIHSMINILTKIVKTSQGSL